MKRIIAAMAAFTAIIAISACSAQAAEKVPGTTAEVTASAAAAVTALETTEDSHSEQTEEPVTEETVEVYNSNGIMAVDMNEDDTVSFGCGDSSSAGYRNSVFIISTEPGTTDETMSEFFEKNELSVVYDYENFNMYAVSVKEPLDAEQTAEFIESLEKNDFILMVEPDSIVTIDGAEVQ